jgi:hypothetical protein
MNLCARRKKLKEILIFCVSRKNAQIPKNEMMRIDHLLRHGERKLAMIKDSNVSSMGTFVEDKKKK